MTKIDILVSKRDRRAMTRWARGGKPSPLPPNTVEQIKTYDGHPVRVRDDDVRTPLADLVALGLPAEIFEDAP